MKYLILFNLGQKRLVTKVSSWDAAVDYINTCTDMADDVILSIVKTDENEYKVTFLDHTAAKLRIVKALEGKCPLGYYAVDLGYIFAKIRNHLLAQKISQENEARRHQRNIVKESKYTKGARYDALGIVLVGLACMLAGFAAMILFLTPLDNTWLYAAYIAVVALGLAITLRGSFLFIWPKKLVLKREKRALNYK